MKRHTRKAHPDRDKQPQDTSLRVSRSKSLEIVEDYASIFLYSIKAGNVEEAKKMLAFGFPIDEVRDEYGRSALHIVATDGPLELVKVVGAASSIWTNETKDGETALSAAASNDQLSIVDYLLSSKSWNEDHVKIAFKNAVSHGLIEMMVRLLDCETSLDRISGFIHHFSDDDGAVHTAIQHNQAVAVEKLLSLGATYHDCCSRMVAEKGSVQILKALLAYCPDKISELHYESHYDTVRAVLKCKTEEAILVMLDILCAHEQGLQAQILHAACESGNLDAIRMMINKGEDLNKQADRNRYNKRSGTPFRSACKSNRRDVCLLLLESGADISPDLNKHVQYCYDHGYDEALKAMSDHGLDIGLNPKLDTYEYCHRLFEKYSRAGKRQISEMLLERKEIAMGQFIIYLCSSVVATRPRTTQFWLEASQGQAYQGGDRCSELFSAVRDNYQSMLRLISKGSSGLVESERINMDQESWATQCLRFLFDNGLKASMMGARILQIAVKGRDPTAIVQLLLENGAKFETVKEAQMCLNETYTRKLDPQLVEILEKSITTRWPNFVKDCYINWFSKTCNCEFSSTKPADRRGCIDSYGGRCRTMRMNQKWKEASQLIASEVSECVDGEEFNGTTDDDVSMY